MTTSTTLPRNANSWGSRMKQRLFWGTPHTETDVNAFEAAMRQRAEDEAAGKYAAVHAVEKALETISRRSGSLLQFDALLAVVLMLLAYRVGTTAPELFTSFTRWSFALALASTVLLLPNLALYWPADQASCNQPGVAYRLLMQVHKMRAARYTFALVFSFVAVVLVLLALTRMS